MKKLATLAMASLAFAVALASCTSAPTLPSVQPIEPLTPQQLVSQACVIVPGVLNILALQADAFPASAQADIKNAQKIVSGSGPTVPGICTIGATVDATSVQTLANTVMPIIVNAVELSPTVTPQVKAEVAAAQGIFLLIQAQQAAQAGAIAPVVAPSLTCGTDGALCAATTAPATVKTVLIAPPAQIQMPPPQGK